MKRLQYLFHVAAAEGDNLAVDEVIMEFTT